MFGCVCLMIETRLRTSDAGTDDLCLAADIQCLMSDSRNVSNMSRNNEVVTKVCLKQKERYGDQNTSNASSLTLLI